MYVLARFDSHALWHSGNNFIEIRGFHSGLREDAHQEELLVRVSPVEHHSGRLDGVCVRVGRWCWMLVRCVARGDLWCLLVVWSKEQKKSECSKAGWSNVIQVRCSGR